MKRKLHLVVIILLGIFSVQSAMSQDVYWREGFDGGTITTTQPAAASNSGSYGAGANSGLTSDKGDSWYVFGAYRTTGSPCATGGHTAYHIRWRNGAISLPDSPYIITPVVNKGVQTVHLSHVRADKNITVFWTADTVATTTNWTLAGVFERWQSTCVDLSMNVNQLTAKRIKFVGRQSTDSDEDSIWMTSMLPLPVKFSGFTALYSNGSVKINWQTATESNMSHYEIERSFNGREFFSIGRVAARDNSNSAVNYSLTDNTPLNGTNYYRIKGVERDGQAMYTNVVKINTSKDKAELNVAPNPVKSGQLNVQLSSLTKGTYSLKLYNEMGQVVFTSQLSTEGGSLSQSFTLPSSVRTGTYSLQVTNGDIKLNKRVVVE